MAPVGASREQLRDVRGERGSRDPACIEGQESASVHTLDVLIELGVLWMEDVRPTLPRVTPVARARLVAQLSATLLTDKAV